MTTNRPEMTNEEIERLLNQMGRQFAVPPMRDIVPNAMARIRAEQTTARAQGAVPLDGDWSDDATASPRLVDTLSLPDDPPRSLWREIGVFAGGLAMAAAAALVLFLLFRGFDPDDDTADRQAGVPASTVPAAGVTDSPLSDTVLLEMWDEVQGASVVPVDTETGEPLEGYEPIRASTSRYGTPLVISDDGKTLASMDSIRQVCEPMSGGTACRASASKLHLVDLASWTVKTVELPGDSWAAKYVFSPNGTRFVLALNAGNAGTIMVFDVVTAGLVAERAIDFPITTLDYALSGAALVAYGQNYSDNPGTSQPDAPRMALLDAATLETSWETRFDGVTSGIWCIAGCDGEHHERDSVSWRPAVTVTPDGQSLVIVHADEDVLTRVDLESGDTSRVGIRADQAWWKPLAGLILSEAEAKGEISEVRRMVAWPADGSRLFLLTSEFHGQGNTRDVSDTLQVLDSDSGRILEEREFVEGSWWIRATLDSEHLLVQGAFPSTESYTLYSPWLHVLDADSLDTVAKLDGWEMVISRNLDGDPVLLTMHAEEGGTDLGLMDLESYQITQHWTVAGEASWVWSEQK